MKPSEKNVFLTIGSLVFLFIAFLVGFNSAATHTTECWEKECIIRGYGSYTKNSHYFKFVWKDEIVKK